MRSKDFKGKCTKKNMKKGGGIVRLYDNLQFVFSDVLENDPEIKEYTVNYYLQDFPEGEFTSDFVCIKANGDFMVRECVYRKKLSLPRTCKLLDASRLYWLRRGVEDWGIVTNKENTSEKK